MTQIKTEKTSSGRRLSIIKTNNWVTYLLARMFLRKESRYYSYLVYAYLRMVDDYIDNKTRPLKDKADFLAAQRKLIDKYYDDPDGEEPVIIARIIKYDCKNDCVLKPFILQMMDFFEFDIQRTDKIISEKKLIGYSYLLSKAYTRFLLYFVDPRYHYQEEDAEFAHKCHRIHMLRDIKEDIEMGYINIPKEDIERYRIDPQKINSSNLTNWLHDQAILLRDHFKLNKKKLDKKPLLIKLIAYLYCFRYEIILNQIIARRGGIENKYPMRIRDYLALFRILAIMFGRHILRCIAG